MRAYVGGAWLVEREASSDAAPRTRTSCPDAPDTNGRPGLGIRALARAMPGRDQENNYAELAHAHLHAAALVCECLHAMSAKNITTVDISAIPKGAKAFAFVTPNLEQEAAASVVREGRGKKGRGTGRGAGEAFCEC